jgi:membrane protein involved in colicin uptake
VAERAGANADLRHSRHARRAAWACSTDPGHVRQGLRRQAQQDAQAPEGQAERYKLLVDEEADKLLDEEKVTQEALHDVEQNGIVFLDEIDKICARAERHAAPTSAARACSATCCR